MEFLDYLPFKLFNSTLFVKIFATLTIAVGKFLSAFPNVFVPIALNAFFLF